MDYGSWDRDIKPSVNSSSRELVLRVCLNSDYHQVFGTIILRQFSWGELVFVAIEAYVSLACKVRILILMSQNSNLLPSLQGNNTSLLCRHPWTFRAIAVAVEASILIRRRLKKFELRAAGLDWLLYTWILKSIVIPKCKAKQSCHCCTLELRVIFGLLQ